MIPSRSPQPWVNSSSCLRACLTSPSPSPMAGKWHLGRSPHSKQTSLPRAGSEQHWDVLQALPSAEHPLGLRNLQKSSRAALAQEAHVLYPPLQSFIRALRLYTWEGHLDIKKSRMKVCPHLKSHCELK